VGETLMELRWKDFIRGEWWIDKYGESIFADGDIGEAGHELIAADSLLDKDALVEAMNEYVEENPDENASESWNPEEWESDETGAGELFFSGDIPDEVGERVAGAELWRDMKQDVRLAFAKREGAILVINDNFYAWEITQQTIKAIQEHIAGQLYEQLDEEDVLRIDGEVVVEEAKTKRHVSTDFKEFMLVKYPRDLWASVEPQTPNRRKRSRKARRR
jgi:hypothetical protein